MGDIAAELDAWQLAERVGADAACGALSPAALAACMLADTRFAAAALELLRAPDSAGARQVATAFPEAVALAYPAPAQLEHDAPASDGRPLLDHIATRLLGTKLAALERSDRDAWRGLSSRSFEALGATCARVLAAGLGPPLRAAAIHLDIAKTNDPALRGAWLGRGIALDVHNEAAAAIVRGRTWGLSPPNAALANEWIAAHGLAGQHVRGEGPLAMFGAFVHALHAIDVDAELALDALHVLNACDTAAVREGLVDDLLLAKLAEVRDQLARVVRGEVALAALAPPTDRAHLAARLRALRGGRDDANDAVAAIGDTELAALAPALATCQLWYCEAATGGISAGAQLGVIAAAIGAARRMGIDVSRPWHAQLRPLAARLAGDDAETRYRRRLVEAALAQRSLRELLAGGASLGPLGTLSAKIASDAAIAVDYVDTAESSALVTLLALYETRSQVAFHQMLKSLCDLYGLRKDQFDRVANEASYLATMNSARTDKERMLDLVRPGRIVEVGPGGGVVLDLLEARFPSSEIVGVDLSREVIAALDQRARAGGRHWRVVNGAAEQLPELVDRVDTVVFCSILHEVYSYTAPRFELDSVARVIRAAYAALVPGGRIVIRDGVRPPPATRRIRFIAADARATFDVYVAQFEGRPIAFRELGDGRVELLCADAMEFLYTYTWGPASFPYEVRELYGILEYADYVRHLLGWCPGAIAVPVAITSYLQPGYRAGLAGKIELTDERDAAVELPDSNCLIAIEKP
ncbi:MAG TPA: methyltransferase [Kofleriaceae bacterium]|jgi:SAM-dependent methyltransferase